MLFLCLLCITYLSQESIDTWNSSGKDGVIIQFQLNVVVLQINSVCTVCSTIAQCNEIILAVLAGKDKCQTAFRNTISASHKFTLRAKQILQIPLSQLDPLENSDIFGINIYLDAAVKVNDFLYLLGKN